MVDLFAGIEGWGEGLRLAGGGDALGVELDVLACASARRAGHEILHADVAELDPASWWGVEGLVASPPCQTFSHAGKGAGRAAFFELARAIEEAFAGRRTRGLRTRRVQRLLVDRLDEGTKALTRAQRASLARWIRALRPAWVALEQVPPVLPLWEIYAHALRAQGYRTWAGTLNAADFGLPQTRVRAILLATRSGVLHLPEPTHARDALPPDLFGRARERWVSMADALGWGVAQATINTRGDRAPTGGNEFSPAGPSWALTEKARSWTLHTNRDQREDGSRQVCELDVPAPALTAKAGGQWALVQGKRTNATRRGLDEPAPSARFEGERDSLRLEVEQGLVLQGFAPDYPLQGSRSACWRQIGNAFPPPLAGALLRALTHEQEF